MQQSLSLIADLVSSVSRKYPHYTRADDGELYNHVTGWCGPTRPAPSAAYVYLPGQEAAGLWTAELEEKKKQASIGTNSDRPLVILIRPGTSGVYRHICCTQSATLSSDLKPGSGAVKITICFVSVCDLGLLRCILRICVCVWWAGDSVEGA